MTQPDLRVALVRLNRTWWAAFFINLTAGFFFASSEGFQWMALPNASAMAFMIVSRVRWSPSKRSVAVCSPWCRPKRNQRPLRAIDAFGVGCLTARQTR